MKLNHIKLMSPRQIRPATLRGLALFTLGCGVTTAWGEGFRNPPPGAFNLGRAGGRIAHVQDASAITHNPANLMALTNAEVQIAPSVVYMGVDFDSSLAPQSAKTENPWKFLPNAFFAVPAEEENMAYGLGITSPYGLSVDWDTEGSSAFAPGVGVLRYTSPNYAELMTLNFNPTIAFNLTDNLSVGLGANVMWSRLTIKQYYPWAIFPGSGGTEPDGMLKGQGDGFGYGGNLGLTWRIGERHTVAFSYRSQMDVDYEGDVELSNITPTAAFLGVTSRSSFDSSIAFPNILAAGYGIQLTDRLRLESNVEWLEFSRFDSLPVDAGNNNIILPPSSQNVPQNWRDTFTVGIAGDYQLTDHWVVRAGYQYYESPVPNSTFSTTIPDADQNVITVGLAYEDGRNAFEIGYGADFYDTRRISNGGDPTFSGTYKITVHLFAFSYRLAF